MMSALPSPLKSPTCTSRQVTVVDHIAHAVVTNEEPLDRPTHHSPVFGSRPAMPVRPSPKKSPVTTSTQLTLGLHPAQELVTNEEPVLTPVHHKPPSTQRPVMSLRIRI